MSDIDSLRLLIERVIQGQEITDEDVRSVRWSSDDLVLERAAQRAWLIIRRFVDDSDIRARDRDYDRSMRQGLSCRLEELVALQQGRDPYRRRSSWLKRMLWRFGLVR